MCIASFLGMRVESCFQFLFAFNQNVGRQGICRAGDSRHNETVLKMWIVIAFCCFFLFFHTTCSLLQVLSTHSLDLKRTELLFDTVRLSSCNLKKRKASYMGCISLHSLCVTVSWSLKAKVKPRGCAQRQTAQLGFTWLKLNIRKYPCQHITPSKAKMCFPTQPEGTMWYYDCTM